MDRRRVLMLLGFGAAFVGDWFLAIRGSRVGSGGFLSGVAAFSAAQVFWMAAHFREARPDLRVFAGFAIPLACFSSLRLFPLEDPVTGCAVTAYAVLSAASLALALRTGRAVYSLGIALLLVSDVLIGCRWLHMPFAGELVGPLYVAAEVCLLVSFFLRREGRIDWTRGNPFAVGIGTIVFGVLAFFAGMATFPGWDYNPLLWMLSALGRTEVRLVEWPLCHFFFILGMSLSAAGIARVFTQMRAFREDRWCGWGAALNVAGLLTIAAIPENVHMDGHNTGCWLGALGGFVLLVRWMRGLGGAKPRDRWLWFALLSAACLSFWLGLVLHSFKLVPFSPWAPSAQKAIIVFYMAWVLRTTVPWATRRLKVLAVLGAFVLLAAGTFVLANRPEPPMPGVPEAAARPAQAAAPLPLAEDELAALRWLEHVTGELSPAEEKDWWDCGGRQFGLFARRYHLAFAGYAAAAIGFRAVRVRPRDDEVIRRVGRVLGNCLRRYVRPDVWAYSQAKSYWGRRKWAPDPCFRENVMYTGHLLQLLALYEWFTGDTRYWTDGWDFVWKGRRVHYTAKKLVDVTVHQMRKGPTGGVTCEPGLLFFPCNNHPQVALRLFAKLGHGDWSKDARRWERWALGHFRRPFFGGGVLNLACHMPSGLFYPRGSAGLDAWSLLWYEAWASDRRTALGLWREAVRQIDWPSMERAGDENARPDCTDPQPAPASVVAAFLSAAARACDDPETAERLERSLDSRYLSRRNGWYCLDLARDWRIGATAQRIIALAESRGFAFREMTDFAIISRQ